MKLSTDRIVDAGLAVYAQVGLHGLSMRAVAARLDTHAGSLYYHVADKARLLALMSDRVARQAYEAGTAALAALPAAPGWPDRVVAQVTALRDTLRRRPGGAELLTAGPALASAGALMISERLLATLADAGVPPVHRSTAADALLSHVTGFVLQEQGPTGTTPGAADLADLAARFPLTFARPDSDEDATFAAGVALICAGIATLVGP